MPNTPRPAPDRDVEVGQILVGKYRVDAILGHGGMGVVAECTHLALNERVAIKMLRPDVLNDIDAVERFMREAQAVVKLRSEYVARVSDVGTLDNGVPYMVMEFLEGQDLGKLVDEQGAIAAQWGTEMVLQAADALGEAHSLGIVHRDVKPSNLFVTWRPDGSALVKVLDFGISKTAMGTDLKLTQTQSLLGTPAYMSPEQMRSARLVDARTDIWSLGTVLYEILEGCRPFEAESFSEMCVKVAADAPRAMVKAPPPLRPIILKCLEKNPEQRYGSMAELARDLIPFVQDARQGHVIAERMERTHRRSLGDIVVAQPSASHSMPPISVIPSLVYEAQTSPPAISRSMGIPVAIQTHHREPSAPARAPSEAHDVVGVVAAVPVQPEKKKRRGVMVLALAVVAIGIFFGAMLAMRGGDETKRRGKDEARIVPPIPVTPAPGPQPTVVKEAPLPPAVVETPTSPVVVETPKDPKDPKDKPRADQHPVRPTRVDHDNPKRGSADETAAHSGSAAEPPKVPCDPRTALHGCNDH